MKTKVILFLLFFPGLVIEMLSGSTPPSLYFNPIVIIVFALTYGIMAILIREVKIRWKLGVSYLFLLPIAGIFIEGLFMQSFANTGHPDLGVLSGYGTILGFQMPWVIYICIMHGLLSLAIPLFITDIVFPSYRKKPLLGLRSTILCILGITLVTLWFWVYNVFPQTGAFMHYIFDSTVNLICIITVLLLLALAYLFRNVRIQSKNYKERPILSGFIIYAFIIGVFNITFETSSMGADATSGMLLVAALLILVYGSRTLMHEQCSVNYKLHHLTVFTSFFIIVAFLQELDIMQNPDDASGMATVAVGFILFFIYLHRKVRREHNLYKMSLAVDRN